MKFPQSLALLFFIWQILKKNEYVTLECNLSWNVTENNVGVFNFYKTQPLNSASSPEHL